jgi:hypothetical protein
MIVRKGDRFMTHCFQSVASPQPVTQAGDFPQPLMGLDEQAEQFRAGVKMIILGYT